jgi:hypothetical protein
MYEHRLVAFIDILGWSELINASVNDAALFENLKIGSKALSFAASIPDRMRQLHHDVGGDLVKGAVKGIVDVTHFSDCVLLSCPVDFAQNFTAEVQFLCRDLLLQGHCTRGAIVVGPHHHNQSSVFGPAFIEAYKLERDVAKYPRIIVTPGALPLINPTPCVTRSYNVRTDFDGIAYVDILGFGAGEQGQRPRTKQGFEEILLSQAKTRLASASGNLGLAAKHVWMVRYLEEVIRECSAT